MLGRNTALMLIYLLVVSSLAYYSYFSSSKGLIVSAQGYCSSTQCIDYQGNCIDSGQCGYATSEDAQDGHPSYCDNGNWVGTACVCLTELYPTCESLGFGGSCGDCSGEDICMDPPGTYKGQEWCYGPQECGGEGQVCCISGNECNPGLNCCSDGKCHECCTDDDCKVNGEWQYDPNTHTKIVCNCPAGCSMKEKTKPYYTCQPLPHCWTKEDCAPDYCCDTITGSKECKGKGTIINSGGKSYLCDPPVGFTKIKGANQSNKTSPLSTILSTILKFFSRVFS